MSQLSQEKSEVVETPPLPSVLSNLEFLGYLAGIIDADGSFRVIGKSGLNAVITNTNKQALEEIKIRIDGALGQYKYDSRHYGTRPHYWLYVPSKTARSLAPYCVKAGGTQVNWGYVGGFLYTVPFMGCHFWLSPFGW